MRKMKGQGWQIEEMLKIVVVMIVFMSAVLIIIGATGGLNSVLEEFCLKNPSWCGERPQCVCCMTLIQAKTGLGLQDIYSREFLWTTEENCIELIKENDGAMYWEIDDPNLIRCGYTPNQELEGGFLERNCEVPEQFVREGMPDCICCAYEPSPGQINVIWDMSWRCEERDAFSVVNETTCGPLYIMPPEAQELTLKRIGKFFGIGGQYCEIPFPYNMTEAP